MQAKARDDLARLFAAELAKAGLAQPAIDHLRHPAPPGADRARPARRDRGGQRGGEGPARPPRPPQALEGFLRKTGLTREQLIERDGVLLRGHREARPRHRRGARRGDPRDRPRLPLAQVDALGRRLRLDREPALGPPAAGHRRAVRRGDRAVRDRRHRQRRGDASATASTTPASITIGSAARLCREAARLPRHRRPGRTRRADPRPAPTTLAAEAGLALVRTRGCVAENAGLTEWPVPLLGRFDAAFLDVPPEVIQLTARVNQKYFVCRDADGQAGQRLRLHRQHRRDATAARRSSRATARSSPRACPTRGSSTTPT